MLGSYFQHQQCARLLSFELLPFVVQPPKRSLVDRACRRVPWTLALPGVNLL
jgi:hypothetical protein